MLNNAFAPNVETVIVDCRDIYRNTLNEDLVLEYLNTVASNDFKCPDRCDKWAVEFLNEYEEEITNEA